MSSSFTKDFTEEILLPDSIEIPGSQEDKVDTLLETHETGHLPERLRNLEEIFNETYDAVYAGESAGYFEDPDVDLAFQQWAIKRDEALNRSQFVTFGTFLPAYDLALAYNSSDQRYLKRFDTLEGRPTPAQTLLLGCSSITTAQEYIAMMKSINANTTTHIIDINPTIVSTLKRSCADFSLKNFENNEPIVSFYNNLFEPISFAANTDNFEAADATKLEESNLPDESQDAVFTSMLIGNLLSSDDPETAILNLFKGVATKLKEGGQFIMIEDLSDQEQIDLCEIAHKVGLRIDGPQGRNTKAPMIKGGRQSINGTIEHLNNEFDDRRWERSYRMRIPSDHLYSGKGFDTDNSQNTGVSLMIFRK